MFVLYFMPKSVFLTLVQNTVKVRLRKAYYNRKPVEKPRKKAESHETESTQEGHDARLNAEMKANKPDMKKIASLLHLSFAKRMKWIESLRGKGSVKTVLEEYPGFKNYAPVSIH